MSYTFLITGASTGLGASLALYALQSGHTVIACSRDIANAKKAIPEVERLRGTWLELDINRDSAEEIISNAVELHHVSVLINAASLALRGRIEDISIIDAKFHFETNFYGALRCIKGAIPHFRSRHRGTIVNVSGTESIMDTPYHPLYLASKQAIEGVLESIIADLAHFNVRALFVQCGCACRAQNMVVKPDRGSQECDSTATANAAKGNDEEPSVRTGDWGKAARAIVEIVTGKGGGECWKGLLRLPLGQDAWIFEETKYKRSVENLKKVRDVAESVDFEA